MNEDNQTQYPAPETKKTSLAIPIAIIVGFGLVAVAIYFSGLKEQKQLQQFNESEIAITDPNEAKLNPITENDHIRGNPNAPIMIVEYSDFDCPFCKAYHETMKRLMNTYGLQGQLAWTYRHFPLPSLHPNAPLLASASECVAKLGGDEAFWKFSDLIFSERDTNDQTDISQLSNFADTAGVDVSAYERCVESKETVALVEEDVQNALSLGVKGTPHSFILIGNQRFSLNGFRVYEEMDSYISSLLEQIETATDSQ